MLVDALLEPEFKQTPINKGQGGFCRGYVHVHFSYRKGLTCGQKVTCRGKTSECERSFIL